MVVFILVKEPVPNRTGHPNGSVLGWHGLTRHGYVYAMSYKWAGLVYNQAGPVSSVV